MHRRIHRDRALLLTFRAAGLGAMLGLVGCQGGDLHGTAKASTGSTTAPTTSSTAPPSTTPPPPPPPPSFALQSAVYNGPAAGLAAKGETVTVTFSKEVNLNGATDPSKELKLLVTGDTWGTGATMKKGAKPTDIDVTLGDKPAIRISGKFDRNNPGVVGDPSGIDVDAAATKITDLQGAKPGSYPIDVDGSKAPGFAAAASLKVARSMHTATLLNDGRILVVGGLTSTAQGPAFVIDPEIYDSLANTFTKTTDPTLGGQQGYMLVTAPNNQALPVARVWHTATKLANGKVLITGGLGWERIDPATNQPVQEDLKSAHVFDPQTNKFTVVQNTMSVARSAHYATLLSNGKVLVAGGFNGALNNNQGATVPAAEIYDATAGTFTPLSSTGQDMTVPRQDGVGIALSKGALFVGGMAIAMPAGATKPQAFLSGGAEKFDEATSKFAATAGKPANDLRWQAAVKLTGLADHVYVLGGDSGQPSDAVEHYDGGKDSFSASGKLKTARTRAAAAVVGTGVVVGGGDALSGQPGHELKSVELYSTSAGSTSQSLDMTHARNGCSATKIGNFTVIFIGGFENDTGTSPLSMGGQAVAASEKLVLP